MECQFAFLCDYAQQDRKLHAIGIGWDAIYAAELPATPSNISVVARLRGSVAEVGSKEVTLRLIDADGADAMPVVSQQFDFGVRSGAVEGSLALVFNLAGLQLGKYGGYSIHLLVNGHEMQRLSFTVSRPPSPA